MIPSTPLRRAFTLIELLVVMAIIGALIGLVIAVTRLIADRTEIMMCQNGLRQTIGGVMAYAVDNQQKVVPADPPGGGQWIQLIQPYVEAAWVTESMAEAGGKGAGSVMWSCPTWEGYVGAGAGFGTAIGYGINHQLANDSALSWWLSPSSRSSAYVGWLTYPNNTFRFPALTYKDTRILLGESDFYFFHINWDAASGTRKEGYDWWLPYTQVDGNDWSHPPVSGASERHKGRLFNYGFCDGSVRRIPFTSAYTAFADPKAVTF
jgi:prepilin-type N-terminal cleavage/methylation domain-containing protein/prepilin-type processing-associated H-X9-DG protein